MRGLLLGVAACLLVLSRIRHRRQQKDIPKIPLAPGTLPVVGNVRAVKVRTLWSHQCVVFVTYCPSRLHVYVHNSVIATYRSQTGGNCCIRLTSVCITHEMRSSRFDSPVGRSVVAHTWMLAVSQLHTSEQSDTCVLFFACTVWLASSEASVVFPASTPPITLTMSPVADQPCPIWPV